CITVNLLPSTGPLRETRLSGEGEAKILVLDLSGLISTRDGGGFLEGASQVTRLKEALTLAAEDEDIKALVVRINSPGGTVTASDILYHELRQYREERSIPIVAAIMDVGASGGYYVAAAADKIVAHPSSVTGSLGVIMLTVNASGLLQKIGVETTAVTSGPRKDMGSPFRPMTDEERRIFQGVIDSFYERFLAVIEAGRPNLSKAQVRQMADGRIYSGEQAKGLGLVDEVGYLDDAVRLAKDLAKVEEARVVTYRRPGEYRPNIYARMFGGGADLSDLAQLDLLSLIPGGTPQFLYLWLP
ncbi:MAG: signal peptide peptidase SppA, partial [Nitrospirales bacterium]